VNFYRKSYLQPKELEFLARYDEAILSRLGAGYPFPVRMRDWELCQVLQAIETVPTDSRILDTGAFNTYLGLYVSRTHSRITVSDLLRARAWKSLLRRLGLAPAKPTEAGYLTWVRAMRRLGLEVINLDLTRIGFPDNTFDCIVSLSVIEHIPAVEQALAEMYRTLAPGGRILLTTDCAQTARPFAHGVRYFSLEELDRLFADYPVTSPRNRPDFAPENWCYGGKEPVVTCFIEITKPR